MGSSRGSNAHPQRIMLVYNKALIESKIIQGMIGFKNKKLSDGIQIIQNNGYPSCIM